MERHRHSHAVHSTASLSLACLEVLVHVDKSQLPQDYVWSSAELHDAPATLQFDRLDDISSCQTAGDSWIRADGQLAVQVPSVIIPAEFNILLNPNHRSYDQVRWSEPLPFRFDPRLFIAEPQVL